MIARARSLQRKSIMHTVRHATYRVQSRNKAEKCTDWRKIRRKRTFIATMRATHFCRLDIVNWITENLMMNDMRLPLHTQNLIINRLRFIYFFLCNLASYSLRLALIAMYTTLEGIPLFNRVIVLDGRREKKRGNGIQFLESIWHELFAANATK